MIAFFLFFLLVFVVIGVSSARKSRGTKHDYYLASSTISPLLVGLSAVATNNSGYMFIGVIGYTYATGLDMVDNRLFTGACIGATTVSINS